jgi:NTP pyrophosphatase (non-canonical NTP hydrolase)
MPIIPEEADLRIHKERLRAFARAREWEQFHTPKNLAMAIAVEAAELMEPMQWLTPDEAEALKDDAEARAEIGSEIADVAIYLIRLADVLGIDLGSAIARKIDRNEERFPVDLVRGRSRMPGMGGDG